MKIAGIRILSFLLMLIFLLSALLVSCTDDNETMEGLPEIRYESNKLTLVENEYVDLCRYMEIIDADSVTFHSSNESVIKVNGYGEVTDAFIGKAEVTVTATNKSGSVTAVFHITVEEYGARWDYEPEFMCDTEELQLCEEDEYDMQRIMDIYYADTVTYVSSDLDVATVDENGVIVARAKGNTVITVTAKNEYGTAKREIRVTVQKWVDPLAE